MFISDGHLGTADYIAIAVSLGITAFVLAAIVFFLWRARSRSEMDANNTSGRVSISFLKPLLLNVEAKNSKSILANVIVQ